MFDVKAGLLKCLFVGREVEAMTMTVYSNIFIRIC